MKKNSYLCRLFTYSVIILSVLAVNSYAMSGDGIDMSIALKAGIFEPDDDLEDFDTGFNGEVAFNLYFSRYFATEMSLGYFSTDNQKRGTIYGARYSGDIDLYSVPAAFNVKGILPFQNGSAYLGAGILGYFIFGDIDVIVHGYGADSFNDDDFIFGGNLLSGITFDITESLFLGLEGKWLFGPDATLSNSRADIEFNINGFTLSGVLGFRF